MGSAPAWRLGAAARCSTHAVPRAARSSVRNAVDPAKRVVSAPFGRERRLTDSSQFSRVFDQPFRSADRFFTVLTRCNGLGHARLGLTVARRVARRASDRNRIKRIAREVFRQASLFPTDFVVMVRAPAVEAENAALRRSLDDHFGRLSRKASDCPGDARA